MILVDWTFFLPCYWCCSACPKAAPEDSWKHPWGWWDHGGSQWRGGAEGWGHRSVCWILQGQAPKDPHHHWQGGLWGETTFFWPFSFLLSLPFQLEIFNAHLVAVLSLVLLLRGCSNSSGSSDKCSRQPSSTSGGTTCCLRSLSSARTVGTLMWLWCTREPSVQVHYTSVFFPSTFFISFPEFDLMIMQSPWWSPIFRVAQQPSSRSAGLWWERNLLWAPFAFCCCFLLFFIVFCCCFVWTPQLTTTTLADFTTESWRDFRTPSWAYFEWLQHAPGPQCGKDVRGTASPRPSVQGAAGHHLPQPARLHLCSVSQVPFIFPSFLTLFFNDWPSFRVDFVSCLFLVCLFVCFADTFSMMLRTSSCRNWVPALLWNYSGCRRVFMTWITGSTNGTTRFVFFFLSFSVFSFLVFLLETRLWLSPRPLQFFPERDGHKQEEVFLVKRQKKKEEQSKAAKPQYNCGGVVSVYMKISEGSR